MSRIYLLYLLAFIFFIPSFTVGEQNVFFSEVKVYNRSFYLDLFPSNLFVSENKGNICSIFVYLILQLFIF